MITWSTDKEVQNRRRERDRYYLFCSLYLRRLKKKSVSERLTGPEIVERLSGSIRVSLKTHRIFETPLDRMGLSGWI